MERRQQLLAFNRWFNHDFETAMYGLNNEEQLVVTTFLKKVIPIFLKHSPGYYEEFYALYEKEILERLRHKAKELHNLKLTDYFDQNSFKLQDILGELKMKEGSAWNLSDIEFKNFMDSAFNMISIRHELLLVADPKKGSLRFRSSKPKAIKDSKETDLDIENEAYPLGDREEFMDIKECAKFLGRSKVTLHEYKKQGLPFYKIGRTIKFKKSEVLDFMRQLDKKMNRKRSH